MTISVDRAVDNFDPALFRADERDGGAKSSVSGAKQCIALLSPAMERARAVPAHAPPLEALSDDVPLAGASWLHVPELRPGKLIVIQPGDRF